MSDEGLKSRGFRPIPDTVEFARTRSVIEASHDAFIGMDAEGRIIDWNPAAERLLGWSRDEAVGRVLAETIIPARYRAAHTSGLRRVLEGGDAPVLEGLYETEALHRNGREVAVELNVWRLDEDDRQLFYAFIRNVSDRRRSQRVVDLLRRTASSANESVRLTDAIERCLELVCEFTGWPVGHAWIADTTTGALHPADIWQIDDPGRFASFRQVTMASRFDAGEGLPGAVLADGRPRWVTEARTDPVFARGRLASDHGVESGLAFPVLVGSEVAAVLEFFTAEPTEPDEDMLDVMAQVGTQLGRVVERERAHEALRHSERLLFRFLEGLPVGVFVIDAVDERPYFANRTARELLGKGADPDVTPDQLAAAYRVVLAGTDEPYPTDRMPIVHALEGRSTYDDEQELIRPDGTRCPIEVWGTPIHGEDGRVRYAVAVFTDIGERRRTEEELWRSNAELEQFASIASHDLREPLSVIAGMLDLLVRDFGELLPPDGHRYVNYAIGSADRMARLVEDLLQYSRVGSRARPPEETDPTAVLDHVLQDLRPVIEESQAQVDVDPLPNVMADEAQLGQVFQNLISNAIKFCGDEPPRVHVGAEQPDGMIEFRVRDNGIGIAPEYHEKIFGIFERLHTRESYEGTGLGLAICQKIIERHGGSIRIESALGEGSTFIFTFPSA